MKPIDVKTSTILTLMLKLVIKMLKLKGNNDVRMTGHVESLHYKLVKKRFCY